MQTEVAPVVEEKIEIVPMPEEEMTRHPVLMVLGITVAIVAAGVVVWRLFGREHTP
jgi:hypothetical protein